MNTDQLTAAFIPMLLTYFGDGVLPHYGRTRHLLERDLYRDVRARLAEVADPGDLTDFNYDLSHRWGFLGEDGEFTIRLSVVGPCALVLDGTDHPISIESVNEILRSSGFMICGQRLLESPVRIWAPEVEAPLYEFLFEFDSGLPWDPIPYRGPGSR